MRTSGLVPGLLRRGYREAAAAALLLTLSKRCLTNTSSSPPNTSTRGDNKQSGGSPRRGEAGLYEGAREATSAQSAPSPAGSSAAVAPVWVERMLDYDAAKVRQLAGVIVGDASPSAAAPRTNASAASVERQLRRHKTERQPASKTARTSVHGRHHQERAAAHGAAPASAAAAPAAQRTARQERLEEVRTVAAWLARLPSPQLATLRHDLVKLHRTRSPAPPRDHHASPLATLAASEDAEVALTALLSSSRLAHYLRDAAAVPLASCTGVADNALTSLSTLTGLLVLVSAAESCVIAGLGAGTMDAAAHPQHLEDCTRLVARLMTALTEELASVTSSNSSAALSRDGVRVDLLPLAVCSLVKLTDLCAFHTAAKATATHTTARPPSVPGQEKNEEFAMAGHLQRLCCAVSQACAAVGPSPASSPRNRELEHFYGTASLALLTGQAEKLCRQLRVLDTAPAYAGCVTAMQTTLLVYTVAILRRALATERRLFDVGVSSSTSEGAATAERAASQRLFTNGEKGRLAKVLEGQWAGMHASDKVSAAEKAQLQHRTANTGLNMSLAVWWKSAAAAAAATTQSGTSHSHMNRGAGSPFQKGTHWCTSDPDHVAVLLASYSALLTECQWHSAAPGSGSSVVPLYSRVVRVGLEMQLAATCKAALCLGIEPRAPPSPSTPLSIWIAARRRHRQSAPWKAAFSAGLPERGPRHTGDGEGGQGAEPAAAPTAAATWGLIFRLASGVRLAATELLHSAVLRLGSQRRSALVVTLVEAVSSSFFAVPRTEYLFGLYTDAVRGEAGAEEAHRRVLAAALGVLLWLRELDAPFSVSRQRTEGDDSAAPASSARGAGGQAHAEADWGVCGTRVSHALDAAFFLCYYHHHWPRGGDGWAASTAGVTSESCGALSPLDAALRRDEAAAMAAPTALVAAPAAVDALLTSGAPTAYVKEVLFRLQHDTGRQLHHLRDTGRLHHFSGELQDRTKLLSEEVLRQRHVRATLSFVQAHVLQPTLLWMPLSQAQELVFILDRHPDLLRSSSSGAESAAASLHSGERLDEAVPFPSPVDAVRTYPKVHVGDITCTFARLHGYLVRRLHVLSGVLREYRSLLLESTAAVSTGSLDKVEESDVEGVAPDASAGESGAPAPSSLRAWLKKNAMHSPQLELHRRNNRHWAAAWAVMLLEECPRLPAQMEAAPRWGAGVVRTLDRMELAMYETHTKGLFINVARSQQQYRELRRMQADAEAPPQAPAAAESGSVDPEQTAAGERVSSGSGDCRAEVRLELARSSTRVPLGVVLDGDGHVVRVQPTVLMRVDSNDEVAHTTLPSPFARALMHTSDLHSTDVVGWRVVRVDGVPVANGREVAAQISGKTAFTVTLQRS